MALVDTLYSTRTMVQAIDKLNQFKPKSFLTKLCFPTSEAIEGEVLEIDIRKGSRRAAAFINPKLPGKPVAKRDFETKQMRPGYIRMLSESSAHDMLKRRFNETPYRKGVSGAMHAARMLGEELAELMDMVTRKIEIMASETLREAKTTIIGDGVDAELDYGRDAALDILLSGTSLWTDAASDPIKDILTFKNLISLKSGLSPDILVLGSDVLNAFLDNAKVDKFLDVRRKDVGAIKRKDLGDGVVEYAEIHGVTIVSYEEYYDLLGVDTPIMPVAEALMVVSSPKAKNKLHYGAIQSINSGVVSAPFWPTTWVENNPPSRQLLLDSAPLTALHEPDTTLRFDPITGP